MQAKLFKWTTKQTFDKKNTIYFENPELLINSENNRDINFDPAVPRNIPPSLKRVNATFNLMKNVKNKNE